MLRALSTVLIISGVLMLSDAALTVAWQEPVSAVYAQIVQGRLGDDLRKLELAKPSARDLAALRSLENARTRMAFLARSLRRTADRGEAVGRIRIRASGELRRRQGHRRRVAAQGAGDLRRRPVSGRARHGRDRRPSHDVPRAVSADRQLAPGDEISVEMPYGRFTYRVQQRKIVAPTTVSVVKRVGYDRLVLSACHPLYSADKRIVVFARFVRAQARGPALAG